MKQVFHIIAILVMIILAPYGFAVDSSSWKLSPEAFGPVQINMSLKQAAEAAGVKFTNTKPDPDQGEDGSCYYVSLKGIKDVSFMVTDNKIVRINVSSPAFMTDKGAKIGDTEAEVQKLYGGKLLKEPHHYDEKGHYLTLIDQAKDRSIRFETNGKVVTLMYSGKDNEVHFVEDCL